jgi:hypothetical protein
MVVMGVLKYGPEVEVTGPAALCERAAETLGAAAD